MNGIVEFWEGLPTAGKWGLGLGLAALVLFIWRPWQKPQAAQTDQWVTTPDPYAGIPLGKGGNTHGGSGGTDQGGFSPPPAGGGGVPGYPGGSQTPPVAPTPPPIVKDKVSTAQQFNSNQSNWFNATPIQQSALHADNMNLAKQIDPKATWSPTTGLYSFQESALLAEKAANSQAWFKANDAERQKLNARNIQIADQLFLGKYDAGTGTYN